MSFETAKRFIDILLNSTKDDNEYINSENCQGIIIEFIGGEPFLEIELIDKITDYFVSQMIIKGHQWATRHMISICSNGVLYFDPKVQTYIKKHQTNMSFSISIDGNKELHDSCRVFSDGRGSYDVAFAAVEHYRKNFIGRMGSKMTLAPGNIMHTFDAVKSLIENGYTNIHLNCVYEEGWNTDHARILYSQLKDVSNYMVENDLIDKVYVSMFMTNMYGPSLPSSDNNWCGGNGLMISLDPNGNIFPCIRFMESSLGDSIEQIDIGDVYTGISRNQRDEKHINTLVNITRRSQSNDVCFECPISTGCAWCTGLNYQLFNTPDKRSTFTCIMHIATSLANVYHWNKVFLKYNENKLFQKYVPDEWALNIIDQKELDLLNKDINEIVSKVNR
jgi:radical SAM peptide maturase (CXXX-repeat target family)